MLGDVIKNNFLEDPPLPLIRAGDDIKETYEKMEYLKILHNHGKSVI